METEVEWDDPRLDEDAGGLVLVGGVPYTGLILDRNEGALVSSSSYVNGVPDGVSRDFVDGNCMAEQWCRQGGLEGPSFAFDADGSLEQVDFYSRGVLWLSHQRRGEAWLESYRIDTGSVAARAAREVKFSVS